MNNGYARRIRRVIDSATDSDISVGLSWYSDAREYAISVAESTQRSVEQVVGVIAALSPQIDWERNKRIAYNFCMGYPVPDQTQANLRKAERILGGEDPEQVLTSPYGYQKTLNFYRCISGQHTSVCVDRHAAKIATGREHNNLRGKRYQAIANAYRTVAEELDITPAQTQAIAWVAWRNQ